MRAGGGKQKGAGFERQVSEQLSRWVTDGARDDCFWRSAMSGGRATVRFTKGKKTASQYGDISAIAPEGHALVGLFVIECKFVKNLNIQSALVKGKGPLIDYWRQVQRDANKANKRPLLIAKQNQLPTLVFMYTQDVPNGTTVLADFYYMNRQEPVSMLQFEELLKADPPQ
jgi:hypothetical protein